MSPEPVVHDFDFPPGHLPHVVPPSAHPTTVRIAGRTTLPMSVDVIDMPGRRVASGITATPLVPDGDQVRQGTGEAAPATITADQRTAIGSGEQPPPRPLALGGGQDV